VALVADKVAFAEKYVTAPDSRPWTIEGRPWIVDEFWLPLDGWKLWPVDESKLCATCSKKSNTLTESYAAGNRTRTKAHLTKHKCAGLKCEPILIVALNLKRQMGKSFNTAAWALAKIFRDENESVQMIAVAEDQVARIFAKNYKRVITTSTALNKRCKVRGNKIEVPKKNSDFEVTATSLSAVSDTRTVVIVEEARSVPAAVAMAVIPTLFARGGWECPDGHVKSHDGTDHPDAPRKCSVCKRPTQPWYGKTLLVSSAGELKDDDGDWYAEFIDYYNKNPHPNVHVFRSQENLNPKVSSKAVDAFGSIFGNLDSTRVYADIEGANEFRRKGETFMSEADFRRVIDSGLQNVEGSTEPCVAFLDTSQSVEKTCLVVTAHDSLHAADLWERLYTPQVKVWLPEDMPHNVIDDEEVYQYLKLVMPMYTGLRRMLIDTRGRPWAVRLVKRLKMLRSRWTSKLDSIGKHNDESQQGWDVFEQRILMQTMRLQDTPGMVSEIRGLVRKRSLQGDEPAKIVDRDRRKSHKDITETIAMTCYMTALEQLKGGGIGLAQVQRQGSRAKLHAILKRQQTRVTRGLGPDSY